MLLISAYQFVCDLLRKQQANKVVSKIIYYIFKPIDIIQLIS